MFYFEYIAGKKVMKSSVLEGLNHFFTTRESIIKTKETYLIEKVYENKQLFCKHFEVNKIYTPSQTHTSNVAIIEENKFDYPETDGLILPADIKKSMVFLNFADCTPLIFYDGKTAAISHAGWRGTASQIASKTIEKMECDVENVKCAIGAAISLCCFNVQENVAEQILTSVKNPDGLYQKRNGEIFIDLKNVNRQQLIEIGLKPENIDICPYCTVCNNDIFFSYRKENATSNRHSAVIIS